MEHESGVGVAVLERDKPQEKKPFIEEAKYSAKSSLSGPEFIPFSGHYHWNFDAFTNSEYQVNVPYRGLTTSKEARTELETLSMDTLRTEPFQQFYRHAYMLQRFASPTVVAECLPLILERTRSEATTFTQKAFPGDEVRQHYWNEDVYLLSMACLETCEEDPSIRLPQAIVKELLQEGLREHSRSLRHALVFDQRNKMTGESIDVAEGITNILAGDLINPTEENRDKVDDLLQWTYPESSILPNLLIVSLLRTETMKQGFDILTRMSSVMSGEKMRKTLREYAESNSSFRPRFQQLFQYMGLDHGEEIAVSLGPDVYDKTDFAHYPPNEEILPFEQELLTTVCRDAKQVLDIGCGTGRHMETVAGTTKAHVAGIDLVEDHIKQIQQKHPTFDVKQGTWFDIPFGNEQYDVAYCLGRSFTHNTTIPDAVDCLNEMKRVVTKDGFILIDLPDPTKGEYFENIKKTMVTAKQKGLKILLGTINDSPDMKHFFDRFAPPDESFRAIAMLAGLKAEKITARDYKGITGETNSNMYWKLTKIDPPPQLSVSEKASLTADARGATSQLNALLYPTLSQTTLSLSEQYSGSE